MVDGFYEAYRNRHELAAGWKKDGKKVFGYFCNYTPEELIYAAGIVPVRIRGGAENVELADSHLPTYCCSYVRSALDLALKGTYNYLDGTVFPKTCDMTRVLPGIWKRNMKLSYQHFLPLPGKTTDDGIEFLVQELRLFRKSLEDFSGQEISDERLGKAIKVYNENRSLMKDVFRLSLGDSPTLLGSQVYSIELAGLVMPKDQHNAMLRSTLDGLGAGGGPSNDMIRLMIAGNTFENIELLQIIEDCGGNVVIDELDIGTRYYDAPVSEEMEPLRALAKRYMREVACPCKHPTGPRMERILDLAREYRVAGVILLNQKYCDSHLYDRPWIERTLRENRLPVLVVEHSDIGWVGGKFKTMVQAFLEMVE
jgi:benzoyl-CoA reductase subunit C